MVKKDKKETNLVRSVNKNIRSSTVRWINKRDPNSKFIYDLLWYYAEEANRFAFGVDIDYLTDIQYTIYDAKDEGHYNWHYDTFWDNDKTTKDRKLSITVQLSNGDTDYEGGEFELDKQYEQPNQQEQMQGDCSSTNGLGNP